MFSWEEDLPSFLLSDLNKKNNNKHKQKEESSPLPRQNERKIKNKQSNHNAPPQRQLWLFSCPSLSPRELAKNKKRLG